MLRDIQHLHPATFSPTRRPLWATYGREISALIAEASAADSTFAAHAASVAALSARIGRELGLEAWEIEQLVFAAVVHDLGKLEVPSSIIAKPGALDAAEWESIRRHPAAGAALLQERDAPPAVVGIVRSHHERWDGAGYPDGLAGEAIPLGARIVAVADAFCAMLEKRPYRAALRPEQARAELVAQAGRQFDPTCADATSRALAAA